MRKFYITGTSRGIGKALAEKLLDNGDEVVGISRSKTLSHKNYTHIAIDLSKPNQLKELNFRAEKGQLVCLINNAGTLGDINYVGRMEESQIVEAINLNVTTPFVLSNSFIRQLDNHNGEQYVINIGSGAANAAYDGWSVYCASKCAIHMLSEVVKKENPKVKMISLLPGIVETRMQEEIRNTKRENFSNVDKFTELHNNSDLLEAEEVALNIISNFKNLFEQEKAVISLSDL